jgi:ABC-2 type transport system ATP-binding protein
MSAILEFDDVERSYERGKPVLDGVTFSMQPGEVVGLLGRNAAGKTTLIRLAMGMLFPHRGRVRAFGMSPTEDPVAVKRRIGFVAEDQVLPPSSTTTELIAFHRYLFPHWDTVLERLLLERFALPVETRIAKLSKGQARQVALLCAVCHRPELLILDEPGGGLDAAARREFLETSIQLLNREGTAILFSSHHLTDVERIGGRVLLLADGKVKLDRELDTLREDLCVAIVPGDAAPEAAAIERLAGCLRVRRVFGDWHAVFQAAPEVGRMRVEEALGIENVRCMSVPLEELFVELVGGGRS